jgi:hypothetical protein
MNLPPVMEFREKKKGFTVSSTKELSNAIRTAIAAEIKYRNGKSIDDLSEHRKRQSKLLELIVSFATAGVKEEELSTYLMTASLKNSPCRKAEYP